MFAYLSSTEDCLQISFLSSTYLQQGIRCMTRGFWGHESLWVMREQLIGAVISPAPCLLPGPSAARGPGGRHRHRRGPGSPLAPPCALAVPACAPIALCAFRVWFWLCFFLFLVERCFTSEFCDSKSERLKVRRSEEQR